MSDTSVRLGFLLTTTSFTTYFNIGYCIMLIPSQIILTYVRPSIWLSTLEIAWGVITGLIAIVHNEKQIYALRFVLGLLESSAWPGMITLLSELPLSELIRNIN